MSAKEKRHMDSLKRELGKPSKLIRIELTQDRTKGTLTISQTKYIESIFEKKKMEDVNLVSTPLDPNVKLEAFEPLNDTPTINGSYTLLMGSLMYAIIGTWPDIAYTVNKLCSFNNNPELAHWSVAKRVLQYSKGTKHLFHYKYQYDFHKWKCFYLKWSYNHLELEKAAISSTLNGRVHQWLNWHEMSSGYTVCSMHIWAFMQERNTKNKGLLKQWNVME